MSKFRKILIEIIKIEFEAIPIKASILIIFILLNGCFSFRKSDKSAIKEFNKAGLKLIIKTEVIKDRNLHYASIGNDSLPTLLFVHGSPGGWHEFNYYMKDSSLMSNFRIISIDRPGFGQSDYGKAMHLQAQADLIGEMLKNIQNGKPFILIGHSYGGPLVALLAADYPDLVSRVVILAGALDPKLEPKEKWRPSFIKPPLRYLMPGAGKQANEELWYLKTDLIELENKLTSIHCPVYVLHAKNDMLVDFKNTLFIKKSFTASEVKVIPFEKGNHFIPFNKKSQIVSLLVSFAK